MSLRWACPEGHSRVGRGELVPEGETTMDWSQTMRLGIKTTNSTLR